MHTYIIACEQSPVQIFEPFLKMDPSIVIKELKPRLYFVASNLLDMTYYYEQSKKRGRNDIVLQAGTPILGYNDSDSLGQIHDLIEESTSGLLAKS